MSDLVGDKLNSVIAEVSSMNEQGYLFAFSRAKEFDALVHVFNNTYKLKIPKKLFEEVIGKLYAKYKWSKSPIITLINQLRNIFITKESDYYFISVLNHVDIKGDSKIGRMRLTTLNEEKINGLHKAYNHSEFVGYKNKNVAIYGPFSCSSYEEARFVGLKKVEDFLNIFRIIFDFIEDGNLGFKTQFGVSTNNHGQYASFNSNFYFADTTWTRQFTIPNDLDKADYYPLLEYLWSLVDSENIPNEISQRIVDALHWFGIAKMSYDPKQQFISYFILLEGLLFAGSIGSKTSDLSERSTKILFYGSNETFKKKIEKYNEVRNLYKLRGDLVHEAGVSVNQDSLKKLNKITRDVFVKYIKLVKDQSFETKTDLRDWVLTQSI